MNHDLTRRDFTIDARYDPESRTVSGVISSSALDHWGDQIDQEGIRVRSSVPLLWQHRPDTPIGRSLSIRRNGDKTVASFRLAAAGIDPTADRIHALAKDGIVSNLSVGLLPKRWEGNTLRESELLEVSLVSLGANPDATVTAVRAAPQQEQSPMMVVDRTGTARAVQPGRVAAPAILRRDPQVHSWQFGRALALMDGVPQAQVDWTVEREISDELAKMVPSDRNGVKLPLAMMLRAIGTLPGDAGEGLAGIDWRPELFNLTVEAIKPSLIMAAAGSRVISTDQPLVVVPQQTAPLPDAVWIARDASMTPQGDIGTRSIDLTPKTVASYHQIKRSALLYSQPDVYNLYLRQITQKQLLAVDKAILYGTGAGAEPAGVITNPRLQTFQFGGAATPAAPGLGDLVAMASLLDGSTAPEDSRGWIMNPCLRMSLMATRKLSTATDSVTILSEGDSSLLMHPITTGPQIPLSPTDSSTDLWFGDFGQCGVCLFAEGTATILSNPFGAMYSAGGTELAIFQDVDVWCWDGYRLVHSINAKSIGKPGTPVPIGATGATGAAGTARSNHIGASGRR